MTTSNTTPSAEEMILKEFEEFYYDFDKPTVHARCKKWLEESLKSYKKEILEEGLKRIKNEKYSGEAGETEKLYAKYILNSLK